MVVPHHLELLAERGDLVVVALVIVLLRQIQDHHHTLHNKDLLEDLVVKEHTVLPAAVAVQVVQDLVVAVLHPILYTVLFREHHYIIMELILDMVDLEDKYHQHLEIQYHELEHQDQQDQFL